MVVAQTKFLSITRLLIAGLVACNVASSCAVTPEEIRANVREIEENCKNYEIAVEQFRDIESKYRALALTHQALCKARERVPGTEEFRAVNAELGDFKMVLGSEPSDFAYSSKIEDIKQAWVKKRAKIHEALQALDDHERLVARGITAEMSVDMQGLEKLRGDVRTLVSRLASESHWRATILQSNCDALSNKLKRDEHDIRLCGDLIAAAQTELSLRGKEALEILAYCPATATVTLNGTTYPFTADYKFIEALASANEENVSLTFAHDKTLWKQEAEQKLRIVQNIYEGCLTTFTPWQETATKHAALAETKEFFLAAVNQIPPTTKDYTEIRNFYGLYKESAPKTSLLEECDTEDGSDHESGAGNEGGNEDEQSTEDSIVAIIQAEHENWRNRIAQLKDKVATQQCSLFLATRELSALAYTVDKRIQKLQRDNRLLANDLKSNEEKLQLCAKILAQTQTKIAVPRKDIGSILAYFPEEAKVTLRETTYESKNDPQFIQALESSTEESEESVELSFASLEGWDLFKRNFMAHAEAQATPSLTSLVGYWCSIL